MRKEFLIIKVSVLCSILWANNTYGQVKIGDNPSIVNPSAVLEIESINKGLLIPRMSTLQRDIISSPVTGLIIFNTTTNRINYFAHPYWYEITGIQLTSTSSALGSSYTSFSNGTENFSANTLCQQNLISTGYTSATCSGNLVIGTNTYPVVLINGQCWMQTNLKEIPNYPCADAINTGCNTWLANAPGDIGSWGYYNTITTNGTAGWSTAQPAESEGLLYQWSAAMNGQTHERAQGVCPTGWHIPSDCEWMYLEHGQGLSLAQQSLNNAWRSTTNEGHKLGSNGGSFTNSSNFTGLLTGFRFPNGTFNLRGSNGSWWTSSETSATSARSRHLDSNQLGVNRSSNDKAFGFSVRCLKD